MLPTGYHLWVELGVSDVRNWCVDVVRVLYLHIGALKCQIAAELVDTATRATS